MHDRSGLQNGNTQPGFKAYELRDEAIQTIELMWQMMV